MNEQMIRNVPRAERFPPAVRAVLDTSVLRSAVWGGRSSTSVVDAWLEGRVVFCVTESIMAEYFASLMRVAAAPLVDAVLDALRSGQYVRAFVRGRTHLISAGPPEDRLVDCARLADAAAVVTHDPSLLHLNQVGGISMLSPGAFVHRFLPVP